jgi:hypothetical protein
MSKAQYNDNTFEYQWFKFVFKSSLFQNHASENYIHFVHYIFDFVNIYLDKSQKKIDPQDNFFEKYAIWNEILVYRKKISDKYFKIPKYCSEKIKFMMKDEGE